MANTRKWSFYNAESKEKFLKTQIKNANSRMTYEITLGNVSDHERFLNKDIFSMNQFELKDTFETLTTNTLSTVSTIRSRIANYIEWAIANHLSENGMVLSWLKSCNDEDLVSVVAMENQYITKAEKDLLIEYARNWQDKAFIMLRWKNIGGIDLSEITGLRYEDLNKNTNEVHLHGLIKKRNKKLKMVEVKSDRLVKLTQEEMDLLERAYTVSVYEMYKGISGKNKEEDKNKMYWIQEPLMDNGYIFRKLQRKSNEPTQNNEIKSQVLTSRLKSLVKGEGYDEGLQKPQIVSKSLSTSGMLNELKELRKVKDILTDDDFRDVVAKFNTEDYNMATLKKLYNFMLKRDMKFIRADN